MGLVVRTIGIARATIKIGMANLVYNFSAPRLARGAYCACLMQKPPTSGNGDMKSPKNILPNPALTSVPPSLTKIRRFSRRPGCRS
jgi:hypothetical protein